MSFFEIQQKLNSIGIKHSGSPTSKGWLSILCPLPGHEDRHFGNCFINVDTGAIKCFSCGQKGHINKFIEEKNEQLEFFKNLQDIEKDKGVIREEEKLISKKYNIEEDFITLDLNPEDFEYTKLRGFTTDYCKEFNIQKCFSYPYIDYFLTPVIDKNKDIYEFEARRLITTIYPKVKYPSNSNIHKTLFNIDNLNFEEDLYVSEGLGSHPKIYLNINRNVTATFGSNLSEDQINLLKKFKKNVYIISDNDIASVHMISNIQIKFDCLDNIYIISEDVEDTDDNFVSVIKNSNPLTVGNFLVKHYF